MRLPARMQFVSIAAMVLLLVAGSLCAQDEPLLSPTAETLDATIMRPDKETLFRWLDETRRAPQAPIDTGIHEKLKFARELGVGTSMSLLSHLTYTPAERQQGSCGNCWNWAGQGVVGIALNVQENISSRLSTQFLNSCKTDTYACCGGWLSNFANWYGDKGYFVPWSNYGANFIDGSSQCSAGASSRSCGTVATSSSYGINSIQTLTVATAGASISQATAIANIKNVVNQNKAIWWGFFLPDQSSWGEFYNFWNTTGTYAGTGENALWDPDFSCGRAWDNNGGGGHAVLLVGYNDDSADPNEHYWIALNSWGTAGGNRPNGLFRLKMNINYGCQFPYQGDFVDALTFQTLDIDFQGSGTIACTYAVSPPSATFSGSGGSGTFNVIADSGCTWSATTPDSWISLTGGTSGIGSGAINFSVNANSANARQGEIVLSGTGSVTKVFSIAQDAGVLTQQYLKNQGFELGENGDWVLYPGDIIWDYPCYTKFGGIQCAQEGEKIAWVGGYNNAYDYFYQDVTIPATSSNTSLQFWYAVETDDSLVLPWDYFQMAISNPDGSDWSTLMELNNTDVTDIWRLSPSFDLSQYLGRTIRIWFSATTDESDLTNFFIDNVELTLGQSSEPVGISGSLWFPIRSKNGRVTLIKIK